MWSLADPEPMAEQGPILLVPAKRGELRGYGEALSRAGVRSVVATTQGAALRRLGHVQLVLVEVERGEGAGWELCRAIRARSPDLPVVAVSGGGGEGLAGHALELGAVDHVTLPVSAEVLAARIRTRIRRNQDHRRAVQTGERFRQVFQVAPVPLFILENGRIVLVNRLLAELVGWTAEELTGGATIDDLLAEEDRLALRGALERWSEGRSRKLRLPVHVRWRGREPRETELTLTRVGGRESDVHVGTLTEGKRRRRPLRGRLKEEYFRSLIEGAHDVIMVLDREGTTRYASPSLRRVMGYDPDELEGRQLLSFVHPSDAEAVVVLFEQMTTRGGGGAVTSRCRLRNAAGDWRVIEFTARDRFDDEVDALVINARDVTEQQAAEDALRSSETRFRLLVEGSRDIFFYVRRGDGTLVYLSPTVTKVLGQPVEGLVGTRPSWLVGEGRGGREALPSESASSRLVQAVDQEGGTVTLELVESPPMQGNGGQIQGFARDVSERERLQAALRSAAFQDALTGLPNRALFTDRVRHAIARMRRHPDHTFALLFLDLDRFKVVNDSLGHSVGDHLLRAVAERLKLHLRPEDTLARFGGDEFAVLLEDVAGPADAPRVAHRIAEVLAIPFDLNGYEIYTSASIGIVMASPSSGSPEALLQSADMAMYRAKAGGGNAFELYDQPMHAEAVRRLQLEGQLRRAVEREELELVYQPILRLSDGAVVGVEALLRWNHPTYGVIEPTGFVGLAEETGFISEIGEWVIRTATASVADWQTSLRRPDLFVTVNLSSRQLRDSSVLGHVEDALLTHDLPPGSLKLEITESALLHHRDRAARTLRELIHRGVEVYLDDFGTGHTSLSNLLALPLNGLKIDRSFVSRMHHDPRYAVLVESTMGIAQGLGLHIVAEGVEEETQANALLALGCEYAQGFYFARPAPAARVPSLVAANGRTPIAASG